MIKSIEYQKKIYQNNRLNLMIKHTPTHFIFALNDERDVANDKFNLVSRSIKKNLLDAALIEPVII